MSEARAELEAIAATGQIPAATVAERALSLLDSLEAEQSKRVWLTQAEAQKIRAALVLNGRLWQPESAIAILDARLGAVT